MSNSKRLRISLLCETSVCAAPLRYLFSFPGFKREIAESAKMKWHS